jgi:hypothetical protein
MLINPPKECEYGQLTVETIDEVAPRLIRFTQDLIARLRACKIEVKTTTIYLLNSTDHPIEVPCSGNGISIQMNFDAVLPFWADSPRARLQVSFNHGRRYFYPEHGKKLEKAKFSMRRVLARFLREIKIEERKLRIQNEKDEKAIQARQNFADLSEKLGISPTTENPDIIRKSNLKLMCLPQTPTQVIIMLTVPYEQAIEISNKYLKSQ